MTKIKKLMALMLAFALVFALCACGSGSKTDKDGDVSENDTIGIVEDDVNNEPDNDEDVEPGITEAEFYGAMGGLMTDYSGHIKYLSENLPDIAVDIMAEKKLEDIPAFKTFKEDLSGWCDEIESYGEMKLPSEDAEELYKYCLDLSSMTRDFLESAEGKFTFDEFSDLVIGFSNDATKILKDITAFAQSRTK